MIILHCVFSIWLVDISLCDSPRKTPKHHAWNSERRLLAALGLPADASDNQIVGLLDEAGKRPLAIGLIRYRKITSASARLLEIVNDEATVLPIRISAAHGLCDFGNKEWIKPLKALVTDPNSEVYFSSKIDIAGLLARAGDYSQFQTLSEYIGHPKRYIRSAVVRALGNFRAKERKEVLAAAELLVSVATSDREPSVRRASIKSLDKIVLQRPDVSPRLLEAAKANLESEYKSLRLTSRIVLRRLEKKRVEND